MKRFIKEPIKMQVFSLVIVFIIAFVIISGVNSYVNFITQKYEKEIINNKNKSSLGQIFSVKLTNIENNFIKIANSYNNKNIDKYSDKILKSINDIELILKVLKNGGTYKEVIPVNIINKDKIINEISYSKPKAGFVLEVIELSPQIIEIKDNTKLLVKLSKNKISLTDARLISKEESSINLLIKHIETHFQRSHESINQIFYNTVNTISKLKEKKEESNSILKIIKYILFFLTLLSSSIITYLIFKKIGKLIKENEDYLHLVERNNKTIEQIFDALPVGVLLIDKNKKIRQVNNAALKLFNVKHKEDIILSSCFDCFITEFEKTCPLKDNKPIKDLEVELINMNGKKIPIIKNVVQITLNNNTYLLEAFIDFTAIKEFEEQLKLAKIKAEESNRLKSAFLANMSHEIRTPMNGIIGFAQFLTNPDLTPEKLEKYSKIIISSGNHLLNIINDIIDIAKIESGQLSFNESKFNVNILLKELYTFFQSIITDKKIDLILENQLPNKEASIKTDPVRLKQILTNLINNAIKFTEKGYIKFGYTLNENKLFFYVKDTGIGIEKNKQKMIFERFSQASQSTEKLYGGTGLGLSISKACVEKLGGDIWLESELGKGSEFHFSIPFKKVDFLKEIEIITSSEGKDFKQAKVLIVEDDETNYSLLVEMLTENNITIIHTNNAEDSIEIINSDDTIKLILLDIQLPKKDGNFAAREIKKIRPEIIIVAQSAYAFNNDRIKSLEAGCDEYLTKPIDFNDLQRVLNKYLDSELLTHK